MSNIVKAIIAAFATPTPAIVSYQERQAKAHAEYEAWYKAKEEKAEIARLESWFQETNRVSLCQANIDANEFRARAIYTWVDGTWKCIGRRNESCLIRK